MSTALFDQHLILRRFNPTWITYINGISNALVKPGAHLYDLIPGIEQPTKPYIDRTLAGEIASAGSLRLTSHDNVFYWDASFVPWREEECITGFLLVVADVTERVLSRQILERKVVDRTQKLSALYDVMTVASEPLKLTDKLDQSLQRVLVAVHAQAGAIQLADRHGENLHLVTYQGLTANFANQLRVLPASSGLSGWTATHNKTLVLSDITTDHRTSDLVRQSGFRAYVGVPMNARGKTIGVLSAYRQIKRPFGQEDIALLDSVADQIGSAVENAKLLHKNEQLLIGEERSRLARELHDAVTQSLYSLTLYAETSMRFVQTKQRDLASEYIELVEETAQQALREMRLLLHNLRPAVLEQMGLVKAIRQRLDAVEKRVGVTVSFQVAGEIDLPAHVEEALYQIVQEALNNALNHSAATKISLELYQNEAKVGLTVSDNGRGFRLTKANAGGGLGLAGMKERVNSLNGRFEIDTAVGEGSKIQVEIDLDQIYVHSDSLNIMDLI